MAEQPTVTVSPITALRRSWFLVVGFGLLVAVLLAGYTTVSGKTYSSSAVLRVCVSCNPDPTSTNPINEDPARIVATEQALFLSDRVLTATATALGLPPVRIPKVIKVIGGTTTDVLVLEATASTAAEAQHRAKVASETYVAQAADAGKAKLQTDISDIQDQITTAQATAGDVGLTTVAGQAAEQSLVDLRATLAQLHKALDSYAPTITVTASAYLPASPSSTSPKKAGALGLVIGLVLGAGLALLRAARRDRFTHQDELSLETGLPVLAVLREGVDIVAAGPETPVVTVGEGVRPTDLIARVEVLLRSGTLGPAGPSGQGSIVLVTGLGGIAARQAVAHQIAAAAALAGRRALLVATDDAASWRCPGVAADAVGMSDAAAGTASVGEVVRQSPLPGLGFVPVGRDIPGAAELLRSPAALAVLARFATAADLVVVAGPAADSATSAALAAGVDASLLVVVVGRTRRPELLESLTVLHKARANLVGLATVVAPSRRRERRSANAAPRATIPPPQRRRPDVIVAPEDGPDRADEPTGPASEPPAPPVQVGPVVSVSPVTPPDAPTSDVQPQQEGNGNGSAAGPTAGATGWVGTTSRSIDPADPSRSFTPSTEPTP